MVLQRGDVASGVKAATTWALGRADSIFWTLRLCSITRLTIDIDDLIELAIQQDAAQLLKMGHARGELRVAKALLTAALRRFRYRRASECRQDEHGPVSSPPRSR